MLFQQPQQQPFSDHKSTTNVLSSPSISCDIDAPLFQLLKEWKKWGIFFPSWQASPPDAIFLDGYLGAGKTTFCRGFILCQTGQEDSGMRFTSPTYLLSNTSISKKKHNVKTKVMAVTPTWTNN
jgi:hypothetical protein